MIYTITEESALCMLDKVSGCLDFTAADAGDFVIQMANKIKEERKLLGKESKRVRHMGKEIDKILKS